MKINSTKQKLLEQINDAASQLGGKYKAQEHKSPDKFKLQRRNSMLVANRKLSTGAI